METDQMKTEIRNRYIHAQQLPLNGNTLEHTLKFKLPKILMISSIPPKECGIATFTNDLVKVLNKNFDASFSIEVCPIESEKEQHTYAMPINYCLNSDRADSFLELAQGINSDPNLSMVIIQHEFGFFEKQEENFVKFLEVVTKPVVMVFHTVLPNPNVKLKSVVQRMIALSESVVVMTHNSEKILINDYFIPQDKIEIIAHGTHLVPHANKEELKLKYKLSNKFVLSTFGLLSEGKSIETTLLALPSIVKVHPNVVFLIMGKTHPNIVLKEGEQYREKLVAMVNELNLKSNVRFINEFLPLNELLEYLQLTDVYLFTSNDPNQAVSGTFSYAISCGCPIVSTPIPHAKEVLKNETGIVFDFGSHSQLASAVNKLLSDENLRKTISAKGLQSMAATAWENSAIGFGELIKKHSKLKVELSYKIPEINLDHIKKMTTDFGIIQFSKINLPDIETGYTLDDNARALIALSSYLEITTDLSIIKQIRIYLNFIEFCLQPDGSFLNYVDKNRKFTDQNFQTNLEDSNGRAIWALGYLVAVQALLPPEMGVKAEKIMNIALNNLINIHSTRAMAFIIKGIYYKSLIKQSIKDANLVKVYANKMAQMFKHSSFEEWIWFEDYLTYANALLPEAMLCASLMLDNEKFRTIAKESMDFLLSKTVVDGTLKVISNQSWLKIGEDHLQLPMGGEQPIDASYSILALHKFEKEFKNSDYLNKLKLSFNWFLGNNHLKQIMYNPCTGGCYDGLEAESVNLNQGAESTISYLMARLVMEKVLNYISHNKFLMAESAN